YGVVGDLGLAPADLESGVLAKPGLRPHRDLDRERQVLAGVWQRGNVELRVAHRADARVQQGALVPLRQRVAQRLLQDGVAADPLDDELRWDLALAKPGHAHVARQLVRGLLQTVLDGVGLDPHVDADTRLAKLGNGGLHRRLSLLRAYAPHSPTGQGGDEVA